MLEKITKPEALELFTKTAQKESAEYQSGKSFKEYEATETDGVNWYVGREGDEVTLYRDENTVPEFILPAEFAQLSVDSFKSLFHLIEASVSYGRNSGASDAFSFADQVLVQEKRGWWV